MKPSEFAAQLISRLESLKRKQDTTNSLEEIQEVRTTFLVPSPEKTAAGVLSASVDRLAFPGYQEEERDEAETALSPHPFALLPESSDEDPQAILDEHLSRVLKTPGCQSPAVVRRSLCSGSPECRPIARAGFGTKAPAGPCTPCVSSPDQGANSPTPGPGRSFVSRQNTKHIHHHYIHHHHAGLKTKEQIEAEATQRVQCLCPPGGANYSDFIPA